MKIGVTVDDRALQRRLVEIKLKRGQAGKAATRAIAEDVQDELKANAPKATGAGAGLIGIEQNGTHADIGQRKAWYLRYHEKGTRKMSAQPFVEESVESVMDRAKDKGGRAYLKELGL